MDRRAKFKIVIAVALVLFVVEVITFPVESVVASPPDTPNQIYCPAGAPRSACTFTLSLYKGAASLSYCFLGHGALYLRGVYYPLTEPQASADREVSAGGLCPSMANR